MNGAFALDYTGVSIMNFNEESSQSKKAVSLNRPSVQILQIAFIPSGVHSANMYFYIIQF